MAISSVFGTIPQVVAAGIAQQQNNNSKSVFDLDQARLDQELKTFGKQGGGISLRDFRNLTNIGHPESGLKKAVQDAAASGLTIGGQLEKYLNTGKTPMLPGHSTVPDQRGTPFQNAFDAMSAYGESGVIRQEGGPVLYKEGFGFTPNPGQTITFVRDDGTTYDVTGGGGPGGGGGVGGGAGGGVNAETDQQEDDRFDPVAFMNAFNASQAKTLETITGQMSKDRQDSEKRFAQLTESFQNQMRQQAANMRERPQVEGIRFATRGTGGATQQQLRRRGVSGTFGRSGDRLMKISSLNI